MPARAAAGTGKAQEGEVANTVEEKSWGVSAYLPSEGLVSGPAGRVCHGAPGMEQRIGGAQVGAEDRHEFPVADREEEEGVVRGKPARLPQGALLGPESIQDSEGPPQENPGQHPVHRLAEGSMVIAVERDGQHRGGKEEER